jgi:hypothetical protein
MQRVVHHPAVFIGSVIALALLFVAAVVEYLFAVI